MMGSAHAPTHRTVFSVSSPNTIIKDPVKETKMKTYPFLKFTHPHVDPTPEMHSNVQGLVFHNKG